ncbi:MAG: PfkB family carbohydrate kinase [Chloroflexi bacterium]|nr:PfkB family carbohydrate kinase [Chloroflexota bacterium]
MTVLVVGSVAYDCVKTPVASRETSLGGSAMYFSIGISRFAPVSVVAVVGDDFQDEHVEAMRSRGVDVSGLRRVAGSTFRWAGEYYGADLNARDTLDTQLNVFADFSPNLSAEQRQCPYLFLANIDPELQLDVLQQMERRPQLVALDSMNFWIDSKRDALDKIVSSADVLFMDEGEARDYAQEGNLVLAARRIMAMGPGVVVVKRGAHGVLVFNRTDMGRTDMGDDVFSAPAYPLDHVVDPTGAGDTFASGFVGYIAATGDTTPAGYRRAAVLGSVMGSFCVQDFSSDRVRTLTMQDIEDRFRAFTKLTSFAPLDDGERIVPSR